MALIPKNTSPHHKSTLKKYFPFLIDTKIFHVTRHDLQGHNKFYENHRSKTFLFEIDRSTSRTNPKTLRLHTNDPRVNTSPKQLFSTSHSMNDKYQISKLLTHFFHLQRVIPKRTQHKYFNRIRTLLMSRITIIKNRATSTRSNRTTKTFVNFTYKKYRFHLGIFVPCNHPTVENRRFTTCTIPSPIILSNNRRGCLEHQKLLFPENFLRGNQMDIDQQSEAYKQICRNYTEHHFKHVTSHRLGISYTTEYAINTKYVRHPQHHYDKCMYRKLFLHYRFSDTAYKPSTIRKQVVRRTRRLHRLMTLENISRDETLTPEQWINLGQKYRVLITQEQLYYKLIPHIKTNRYLFKKDTSHPVAPPWTRDTHRQVHSAMPNITWRSMILPRPGSWSEYRSSHLYLNNYVNNRQQFISSFNFDFHSHPLMLDSFILFSLST
ncbi:hypothetical protein C1645_882620 [Glomus cerebriforme]|uniref:DUF8211 domain-containing protein n=1 Tax=Glomus cerebriforme TaxID=658196 RepID=A0A397S5F0_9GLOM|nr:hypothetical protein C1645_882620 [Glomus cerebriforme]